MAAFEREAALRARERKLAAAARQWRRSPPREEALVRPDSDGRASDCSSSFGSTVAEPSSEGEDGPDDDCGASADSGVPRGGLPAASPSASGCLDAPPRPSSCSLRPDWKHHRRAIEWRCQWIELRMQELRLAAHRYEAILRQLEAHKVWLPVERCPRGRSKLANGAADYTGLATGPLATTMAALKGPAGRRPGDSSPLGTTSSAKEGPHVEDDAGECARTRGLELGKWREIKRARMMPRRQCARGKNSVDLQQYARGHPLFSYYVDKPQKHGASSAPQDAGRMLMEQSCQISRVDNASVAVFPDVELGQVLEGVSELQERARSIREELQLAPWEHRSCCPPCDNVPQLAAVADASELSPPRSVTTVPGIATSMTASSKPARSTAAVLPAGARCGKVEKVITSPTLAPADTSSPSTQLSPPARQLSGSSGSLRRRASDYDINNIVMPASTAVTFIEQVRHEFIETPLWRQHSSDGATCLRSKPEEERISSDEDTDDEVYAHRHAPYEAKERQTWAHAMVPQEPKVTKHVSDLALRLRAGAMVRRGQASGSRPKGKSSRRSSTPRRPLSAPLLLRPWQRSPRV
eukprot:SM000108S14186  [mRNA]  locus=s108:130742:133944:+ [translate_table: standard]